MKNILLIILLFVSLIGYSQNRYHIDEVTTQSDTLTFLIKDSSSVNGVVFELYENGQLKDEKYYKDGKPDGLERRWNEDGQLTHEWEITEIDGKEVSISTDASKGGKQKGEDVSTDEGSSSKKIKVGENETATKEERI